MMFDLIKFATENRLRVVQVESEKCFPLKIFGKFKKSAESSQNPEIAHLRPFQSSIGIDRNFSKINFKSRLSF